MKHYLPLFFLAACLHFAALSQDTISMDAYDRAVSFMWENHNNKKTFNTSIRAHWFSDSTGLWYVDRSPGVKKYMTVALPNRSHGELFDHDKVADLLSDSLKTDVQADDLPIDDLIKQGPHQFEITIKGESLLLDAKKYSLSRSAPKPKEDIDGNSPDEKWTAYTEDYNLFVKSNPSGKIRQLSFNGEKDYEYASWIGWADIIEGENGKRPDHFAVNWSEDSKWVHANICDLRTAQKMYLLDWSVDSLYRPRLLSYYRGSPGDTDMVYMHPVFFNVETGQKIRPDLPRTTHINGVNVKWSKQPGKVFLTQTSRGYQHISIFLLDLETEQMDLIYSESSETNIDNFESHFVEGSNLLMYLSEKSGWRQLYSLNLKTGEDRMITDGMYYVHGIKHIDEDGKRVYFTAAGMDANRNPYHRHLFSISFDGEDQRFLTSEDLNHEVSFAPDGQYFVDNMSTVQTPTVTVLRSTKTGESILELGRAKLVDMDSWSPPEAFSTTSRDGKTKIYGALWKPTNFDPSQRYPVIEMSYTGPHTQVFPREFSRAFGLQSYAELGFIVMVVDGLGSSGRSKEFHNYSYKNLGGNLEDHVLAITELGKRYQWFDADRVGIFGHSAGGYDAGHAVLAYPNTYKVAVASSADHDHRMEKAWWPEMYMGWPVDSAYHLQSNITMAPNLKGKLLITHGGIDENVNPSATFKLAEALIKADKQFDMLILPSQRHGYQGDHQKYFTKTRWNYFIKHLRGVEPIWDFAWD